MTSRAARSSSALHCIVTFAAVLSGCVFVDGPDCNGEVCCDEYGCYNINDDDDGVGGSNTTSGIEGGAAQGGAAQGGAGQGGDGGAGGASGCDDTLIVCACADSSECPEGLSCLDGQCLSPCEFDYQCGEAQVCADGQCVAECDADVACTAGYVCIGGGCLPDAAQPECMDSNECEGVCVEGFCTTTCDSNAACPPGQLCDAASSSCFQDPSPQAACDAETGCSGVGQTCMEDGYCHYACETTEECKLIDARYDACDRGVCKTDLELDPDCTYELPCPEGSYCVSNECATLELPF